MHIEFYRAASEPQISRVAPGDGQHCFGQVANRKLAQPDVGGGQPRINLEHDILGTVRGFPQDHIDPDITRGRRQSLQSRTAQKLGPLRQRLAKRYAAAQISTRPVVAQALLTRRQPESLSGAANRGNADRHRCYHVGHTRYG